MTKCPHADIKFCPLYVAAHEADGFGCDDGRLGEHDGCAVARGMNYGRQLAKLAVAKPQMVAELAFMEVEEERKQQRSRNLRLNGIH